MKKSRVSKWKFFLRGSILGILSAFIASIAFSIIDDIIITISISGFSIPHLQYNFRYGFGIKDMVWIIGMTFFLTSLPALFGGFFLAYLQRFNLQRGKFTTTRGMIQGGILGILAAMFVSCVVISYLIFHSHRIPALGAVIIHVSCAVVTAMLAGMWTGRRLALHLQKMVETGSMDLS